MRGIRKLIGVTALAVGSLAFGGTASAAIPSAAPPDGTPAVPYVAWVGEHVQIAACPPAGKNMGTGASVVYQLEDWSGIAAREPFPILSPQVSNFSDKAAKGGVIKSTIGTNPTPRRGCAVQEWSALKPGIARFKVYQSTQTGDGGTDGVSPTSSNPVIVRVIWLAFDGVSLTHSDGTTAQKVVMAGDTTTIWHQRSTTGSEADQNRGNTATIGTPLYAPDKSTYYDPAANRYQVKVTVKGAFPLGENYARWHSVYGLFGTDGLVHLPAQWSDLGRALANDLGATDENGFDIHDDNVNQPTDLHYVGGLCPGLTLLTTSPDTDQVDTCFGNIIDIAANVPNGFSRVWSSGTYGSAGGGLTTGPFNPIDADASWLPDGKVDAGDAPMPAARVDFAIAQNTGGATDTTGVGYLTDVRKQDVYVRRDATTKSLLPHAWYAPFYVQNIPASRDYFVPGSGVSGTQIKDVSTPVNVSNGWLPFPPAVAGTAEYENWARGAGFLRALSLRGDSACVLDGLGSHQETRLALSAARFRPRPYNESRMAVYTDEHGEAYAAFVPGVGAYYDAFGVKNSNGGCDLQDDAGHPFDLGTASVTAQAFYPYQQGEGYGPELSNPVSFRVTSKFTKLLNYYPKGPSLQDQSVRIVVAHAQDVDGSPLVGETVCFQSDRNAEGMTAYRNPLGIAIKGGATWLSPAGDLVVQSHVYPDPYGLGRLCGRTDQNGNVAIEVFNSNHTVVDVIADFVDEGLFRDRFVDFSKSGSSATDIAGGSSAPSAAHVADISAVNAKGPVEATKKGVVKRAKKAVRTARIASASVKRGHLVVRVNGTAKTVRIRIAMTNSKGKTRVVIRSVAVNKSVTVKKVRITKKTGKISVAVLAG